LVLLIQGREPVALQDGFTCRDLGCGQGKSAELFAACHPEGEFHAIDFNPSQIAGARRLAELGNGTFWEASFANLAELSLPLWPGPVASEPGAQGDLPGREAVFDPLLYDPILLALELKPHIIGELSFCIINDPAPRFAVDLDENGKDNCFATLGRNLPEEVKAMRA
jgi:hypothetical protein